MSRLITAVLLLCAIVLVVSGTTFANAISTKVGASERFCVSEHVKKDQKLYVQFQVVAGGKLDIDAFVYDTAGRQIHVWNHATSGDYDLMGDAENDVYQICFSNEMARFTPKWVDFSLRKGQLAGHLSVAQGKDIDPIEQKITNLRHSIDSLHDAQQRLKVAEKDHRATIEDANDRILLWSIFEVVVFFVMGIFQIFFLKRFLERKTHA